MQSPSRMVSSGRAMAGTLSQTRDSVKNLLESLTLFARCRKPIARQGHCRRRTGPPNARSHRSLREAENAYRTPWIASALAGLGKSGARPVAVRGAVDTGL